MTPGPESGADPGWDPVVLDRLAEAGDGEAAHRAALLAGIGLGRPHDFPEAMRRLGQAADLGHDLATDSLSLLNAQPGGLASWLGPPLPRLVSERPHVLLCDGFVSPAVCDWLMDRARPHLAPARVYDLDTGEGRIEEIRSNTAHAFDLSQTDMVLVLLRERIARLAGLPVAGFEASQVLRYTPGQQFDWHVDFLDPATPGHRDDLARRGQRIATCLVWLDDDHDGGETAFSAPDLKLRGRKGDAILWANVTPDGRADPLSRHAGLPPTRGEKWVLSQWMRPFAPRRSDPT
ncbi:MAG: 2OG-Fe(II) oxygenase [Brevundimonas sp.]|uniref:2OG-Fe(II) oxygenase n=1 Tax=Brevundimonas sp. TaxID=1871086 RepID=UPI004033DC6D